MFKFLHAADIHLDSPPRGLIQCAGVAAESLRDVTRRAFDNLVELALAERVAFLVIAGDLFDGDWRDFNTGLFLARQLGRLRDAGIRVYIVYGNHDAESNLTKSLPWPEGVHVFGSRPCEPIVDEQLGVALHGRSFKERETMDNLVPSYSEPVAGALNIGILHTAVEGNAQHASYAPTSLEELKHKGYDYWALGHVHAARVWAREPWIVFPGNLQGRNIRETGAKGACLVTVEERRIVSVEPVVLDVLRWRHLEVDVAGAASRSAVEERVREAMTQAVRSEGGERLLAMRITVRGACRAHSELIAHEEELCADLRALAAGLGGDVALVEKVRIETRPELSSTGCVSGEATAVELWRMVEEASADAKFLAQLKDDFADLLAKLPAEARLELEPGPLTSLREGRLDELVRDAALLLRARLDAGES